MGIITSSFITNDADPVTGLTPTERNLVQNSWAPLKNDLTGTGIKLLLAFYEKYPEELQYFPFRHVPREALSGDKKFQGFCSMVIRALDSLIDSLNDSELLMNLLQNVGRGHRKYGIKPQSFWRLKETTMELFRNFMSKEEVQIWDKTLQIAFRVLEQEL